MTETNRTRCILCDKEIPPGADKCPLCGTPARSGSTGDQPATAPSPGAPGSYLSKEIPKIALPEIASTCPFCSLPIDDSLDKCPRCGIPLRAVKETPMEMLECPECGTLSPASAEACSKCGVSFVEEPSPALVQPQVVTVQEEPLQPTPKKTPFVPFDVIPKIPPPPFTPGRGITNGRGAINGTSMTNGRGAVNGTGMVNGTGVTNGTGVLAPRGVRASVRTSLVKRWQFLAVLVAVLIVVPTFMFLAYYEPAGPAVDGKYGDWSHAEMFGMYVPATGSGIAVQEWSVQNEGDSLYVYVSVEGTLMSTSNVDSFYVFVDSDNDAGTGYSISGMGADFMLVLDGWDGQVRTSSVLQYNSAVDRLDWNKWTSYGSIEYSVSSGKLEARGDLPVVLGEDARYLLLSQTSSPDQDFSVSYPVPEKGGLLIARLEPGTSINPNSGTVPAGASVLFARLVLSCEGKGGSITGVTPTIVNASLASSLGDISLVPGESNSFDVRIDTSSIPATTAVSVLLAEDSFSSTFSDVTILQDSVRAYVASAPASIQIDGAFGDWLGRLSPDNDSAPIANPNINITTTGFAGMATLAAFYVSVEGEMFQGVYAPSAKAKPSGGGGGGGTVIPRKSGEDILRIFVDSDISNTTGLPVIRSGKLIGADYLLDIRGFDGQIVSKSIMAYDGLDWNSVTGAISAAKDLQRLELSVPVASIGGSASIATIIETTDWKDRSDWAWAAAVPDPWVVTGPGDTYQSATGAIWSYIGTPTLEPGDHIADIAMTTDNVYVLLVTNTGRTFWWKLSTSTSWTAGMKNPIDIANYSEGVSMDFFSKTGAWLLTKNGSYFWLMDAISPPANKEWTYQDVAASGVTDFTDIVYESGTMYALRYGPNTGLSYSNNGNSFISVTNPTGSTTNQPEFTYIPGGAGPSDDRIFVLCEDGKIRYSADGGQTWSAHGNLPTPTGTNTSKYVGIGIDSTGYMWVVTDTGYCYRSADATTYTSFNYTGQAPTSGIVAVVPLPTAPIPEFQYVLVPVMGVFLIVLSRCAMSRRRDSR